MNSKEFIEAIKIAVYQSAVKSTIEHLKRPAGRRPNPQDVELSKWYNNLTAENQEQVRKIIDSASQQATYNFLLVLDHLSFLEDVGEKGTLELMYKKGDESVLLNNFYEESLTNLFKEWNYSFLLIHKDISMKDFKILFKVNLKDMSVNLKSC